MRYILVMSFQVKAYNYRHSRDGEYNNRYTFIYISIYNICINNFYEYLFLKQSL